MPVVVTCRCGQSFRAIDQLAGTQVNCPSCGQPLAIPPLGPATSAMADGAFDLGDASGIERAVASAPDPMAGADGGLARAAHPAFPARPPSRAEGMDRSVVVAMGVGGSVVVLLILAMVLTSLLSDSTPAPPGQSVAEGGSPSTPAVVSDEPKPGTGEKNEAASVPARPPKDRSAESAPSPSPPPEPEPKRVASKRVAASTGAAAPEKAKEKMPRKPPRATRQHSRPSPPSGVLIELSAGTALAQTLPTGTAMGFSVDYKFIQGQPDPTADYFWVIETGDGKPMARPIRLKSRGTLQDFVPQLRPENGPFRTHIEDRRGNRLSASLQMR